MTSQEFLTWERASRDCMDVKRCYIDLVGGDLVAGVLLSQLIYWHLPTKEGTEKLIVERDGHKWLAKGRADWWEECRVSPKQFDRIAGMLEEMGLIETAVKRFNGNPTKHIRICWDIFLRELTLVTMRAMGGNMVVPEKGTTPSPRGKRRCSQEGNNDVAETGRFLTETPPQTPTETNSQTKPPAPPPQAAPVTEGRLVGEWVDFGTSPEKAPEAVAEARPDPVGELAAELIGFGMARDKAAATVAAHGEARVREVLAHQPDYPEAKRRRAWLEKALAGGWQVGPAPREWVIKGGADIDRLLAAHGRGAVVLEMERRAAASARAGRDAEAAHRRRVAALVRAGGAGAQAVEAAQAERGCNVARAGKIGGVRDENTGERRHR